MANLYSGFSPINAADVYGSNAKFGSLNFGGNSTSNGGGGMDLLTAGLGLGSSLIGGIFGNQQAKTAASIASAQLKAQNQAMLEAREAQKGQLGYGMWGALFGTGTGADIEFARQKEAQKWMQGPFADRAMGIASEQSKRERLARISPESKEASRFENLLNMKRTGFQEAARMEGMFGPTAFSRRFTNI